MKTNTRTLLLPLALSFSLAACKGNRSGSSVDSSRVDSSSVKVDSTVKIDSPKTTDSSKKKTDTVSQKKTTEEKKSAKKTY